VLSIVEHPAFQSFYDELLKEGVAGTTGESMDDTSSTGDVIAAELREGFEKFDFGIPFILREADELRGHAAVDVLALPAFTAMSADALRGLLGKGDTFISQDLQSATLFGDYRVDGAVMNVGGYNDYLARLTRRISQALSEPLPKGNKIATHLAKPYLQVNTADLTGWLDDYIWTRLFGAAFNPLEDENWRLLLLQPVVEHITKVVCRGAARIRGAAPQRPNRGARALPERSAAPDAARGPFGGGEQVHLHPPGLARTQWWAGAHLHPLGAG
jgi:hypothetical protein